MYYLDALGFILLDLCHHLSHQIVKFIIKDKQVTIFARDGCTIVVNKGGYGDIRKKAIFDYSFKTADIVSIGWTPEGKALIEPMLPEASFMMAKELKRPDYQPGHGIGKNLQDIVEPIELLEQKKAFRLGFHPTNKDLREMKEKKRAEKEGKSSALYIPPLHQSFPHPSGVIILEVEDNGESDIEEAIDRLFIGTTSTEPALEEGFALIEEGTLSN